MITGRTSAYTRTHTRSDKKDTICGSIQYLITELKLNNMYQTNQQAWDEVAREYRDSIKRTEVCRRMFGQDNLIGLSQEQRDLFWSECWKELF